MWFKTGAVRHEAPQVEPNRRSSDKELQERLDAYIDVERRRTAFLQRLPDPSSLTEAERSELLRLDQLVSEARKAYDQSLAAPHPPWTGPERRRT